MSNIGVAMFTVSDQDAALAFYTGTLGWEVRGDTRFGPSGEHRWIEVAPPGSVARLAVNPPMGGTPGGAAIGVEVDDVLDVPLASAVFAMAAGAAMVRVHDVAATRDALAVALAVPAG